MPADSERPRYTADANQLLAVSRQAHRQLNPGATEQDAADAVTSAADAIFTLLEQAGVLGSAADATLAAYEDSGLALGGWARTRDIR